MGFLGLGVVLPGVLLAIVVGGPVAVCLYAVKEVKRAYEPGRSIRWACGKAVANFGGVKLLLGFLAGGLFVEAAFGPTAVLLVHDHHTHREGIFLPSLWLMTAVGAAAGAAAGVRGWARRTSRWGRWLLLIPPAGVAAGVLLSDCWGHAREAARYEWVDSRVDLCLRDETEASRADARRWANRMIALRPTDPRGYVQRLRTYRLQDRQELLADIETAERLGCDRAAARARFADLYSRLGMFDAAVREYEAALARSDPLDRGVLVTEWRYDLHLAKLDAGRYEEVIEWCSAALRPPPPEADRLLNLLALAQIGRGDYAAAHTTLTSVPGSDPEGEPSLLEETYAWLLATCPDPAIRDGRRAADRVRRYIDAVERKRHLNRARRDDFLKLSSLLDSMYRQNLSHAQRVLAAALLEAGETAAARSAFAEWARYVEPDEWASRYETGFWGVRFRRLEACVREGKPFREGTDR